MKWAYLVNRLKEPSTYAGFAGIAGAVGISSPTYAVVTGAVAGVAGLVAIFVPDPAKPAG